MNIRFYNAFNEIVQTLSERPEDTGRFEMRVIAIRMSFWAILQCVESWRDILYSIFLQIHLLVNQLFTRTLPQTAESRIRPVFAKLLSTFRGGVWTAGDKYAIHFAN